MSHFPTTQSEFASLRTRTYITVKEATHRKYHNVFDGAPCAWSKERGATHTLFCGEGPGRGTRPAKLLKTVLHVGVDEDGEGGIKWERWQVRHV